MKTEIGRLKIKQILKSYIKENKTSNVILEQNNDISLPNKLKRLIGCFPSSLNPTVVNMGGDGNYSQSIKTTGPKGGVRYFYIDGKVAEQLTPDGVIQFRQSPWDPSKCAPSQQLASYTQPQLTFIKSWKQANVGAKLKNELKGEELNTYTKKIASPKTDGIFTEDLFMWLPPVNLNDSSSTTTNFTALVRGQTPKNNKDCKDAVKNFYDAYINKLEGINQSEILTMNKRVKACRTRYYKKWGFLQGGNKLDDMLEKLSQITPINSPWYVKAG